jgi:hypothetical protein
VFTEQLLRNGLPKPVVPPLLGANNIENTASSIVACWTVFTEMLPGNAFFKSVTIFIFTVLKISDLKVTICLVSQNVLNSAMNSRVPYKARNFHA